MKYNNDLTQCISSQMDTLQKQVMLPVQVNLKQA